MCFIKRQVDSSQFYISNDSYVYTVCILLFSISLSISDNKSVSHAQRGLNPVTGREYEESNWWYVITYVRRKLFNKRREGKRLPHMPGSSKQLWWFDTVISGTFFGRKSKARTIMSLLYTVVLFSHSEMQNTHFLYWIANTDTIWSPRKNFVLISTKLCYYCVCPGAYFK